MRGRASWVASGLIIIFGATVLNPVVHAAIEAPAESALVALTRYIQIIDLNRENESLSPSIFGHRVGLLCNNVNDNPVLNASRAIQKEVGFPLTRTDCALKLIPNNPARDDHTSISTLAVIPLDGNASEFNPTAINDRWHSPVVGYVKYGQRRDFDLEGSIQPFVHVVGVWIPEMAKPISQLWSEMNENPWTLQIDESSFSDARRFGRYLPKPYSRYAENDCENRRYQSTPMVERFAERPSRIEEYIVTIAIFGAIAYAAYLVAKKEPC